MRERLSAIIVWVIISVIAAFTMLRDLWKYGEFRGGHVPKLSDDGEYRYCALCGLMNPDAKITCREFSLHWH